MNRKTPKEHDLNETYIMPINGRGRGKRVKDQALSPASFMGTGKDISGIDLSFGKDTTPRQNRRSSDLEKRSTSGMEEEQLTIILEQQSNLKELSQYPEKSPEFGKDQLPSTDSRTEQEQPKEEEQRPVEVDVAAFHKELRVKL